MKPLPTNSFFLGMIYIALISLTSYLLVDIPVFAQAGISSLVIAILLGITIGNTWHHPASWLPGIQFCAKRLLRLAIILYGFRISFQQIASLGLHALALDVFVVASTLVIGFYIGKKVFKLDNELALLISSGAAICGAAAVLAVEDVLKSDPYKASVAIATVVLFGTLSMFIYPAIQHAGYLGLTSSQFGLFAGASIHEVAQVIVAGTNISPEAGKIAVIVKMIRVLLLVPVLFILCIMPLNKKSSAHQHKKIIIPWFALGFLAIIAFHSLGLLTEPTVSIINKADVILLTMAMAAIGSETKLKKIKQVGLTPFYFSTFLFLWLGMSVYALVHLATG